MLVLHPRCLPERNVKALRIVSIPLLSFIFSQSVRFRVRVIVKVRVDNGNDLL